MAPTLRTHSDVARWTAIQTLVALACVLPATALASLWLCGGDLARPIGGLQALQFGLGLAGAETLIFTPIVAMRSIGTLRALNLARDELDRLAHTDPLTGLLNRRGFDKAAATATRATLGRPAAVLMCDLDHFKAVNDRHGHEFGDAALRQVAEVLRAQAERRGAVLARLGGEEFVLLLPCSSPTDAFDFAETLRLAFDGRPIEPSGARVSLTLSVGCAATPACERDIAALVARADAALYEAKRGGRNCVAYARDARRAAA